MQLRRFEGVADFLDSSGSFLAAREAEHNLYRQIGYEPVCDVDQYAFG
jgi:hypothetical protein